MSNDRTPLDRRLFLGASTATLLGMPRIGLAQPATSAPAAVKDAKPEAKKPSEHIADFVVGFDLNTVPPIVRERARVAFVDTLGVMLAGSQLPPTDIICDLIKAEGSAPAATIVGRALRASPQLAALANGVSDHAMDFDLTYFAGQSVAAVIPAILPVAETTRATPAEMLAAFIVAAEVAGRLFRAGTAAWRSGGWHATGTSGAIAAAVACARLMKIPADKIADIVGIAASTSSGLTANFGTMTKPLHSGHAAQNGVFAAMLGARGFTAHPSALEAQTGYFASFLHGLKWSVEPFADLGKTYDLDKYGYKLKPYPSGGLGHTAIDAALELRETVKLADVAHVDVAITKYAARRYTDKYPQTAESAKFSGPYLAAYTLVHGAPLLAAFTEEALHDEAVRGFARKVSLSIYQEHADLLEDSPAKVTVTLNDGRKLERARFYPSGSVQVPMTPAQIEEKFMVCATTAIRPDAARKVLAMLAKIDEQPSFDAFWPLVRKD